MNPSSVIECLSPFVTPQRKNKIREVLLERTQTIVPVLECISDRGNLNAIFRSAESLGYQDIHIIENQTTGSLKRANRVTQGSDKWLNIHSYSSLSQWIQKIDRKEFQILVTDLRNPTPFEEIDFTKKSFVVFGAEKEGVSEEMVQYADARFSIPMVGFTQSFNVSVAAALTLNEIRNQRIREQGLHGDLSPETRLQLTADFMMKSVSRSREIISSQMNRSENKHSPDNFETAPE